MANQQEFEVKIKVTAPSLKEAEQQVANLGKSVNKANKEVEDFSGATDAASEALGKLGINTKVFSDFQKGAAKVVLSLKTVKGAVAATGIGLLVTGLASLVAYFKSTEEGSKKLDIALQTISILFGQLTEYAATLGEKLVWVFQNPIEALTNFGNLIRDKIVAYFRDVIEGVGLVGEAFSKLFKGQFKEAGEAAKEAFLKFTLVDEVVEAVVKTGEKVAETFKEVKKQVAEAVETATTLVTTQRDLRNLQQQLIVENALLNKELEKQKKIAEDTTLDYETRKTALDEVNKTQIALAGNLAKQAKVEEDLLKLQIQTANTYEEREELETQLAEATAARIEAETTLQTVTQEAAKLSRELDQEELDRKKSILKIIDDLNAQTIKDEEEAAMRALQLAEEQTLLELERLKGTEEEKQAVRDAYAKLREQKEDEFREKRNKKAEEDAEEEKERARQVEEAKWNLAFDGLAAISALADAFSGESEERQKKNFKIQKALSLAQATLAGVEGVQNAFTTAQKSPITALFPGYPFVQAGIAGAFALAQVAAISKQKFESSGGAGAISVPTGGAGQAPVSQAPQAPQNFEAPQQLSAATDTTVKAYVLSGDVRSTQEADAKLANRRTITQ